MQHKAHQAVSQPLPACLTFIFLNIREISHLSFNNSILDIVTSSCLTLTPFSNSRSPQARSQDYFCGYRTSGSRSQTSPAPALHAGWFQGPLRPRG